MKSLKYISIILLVGLALQSCKKEEETKLNPPLITYFEFGYEDSGLAYLGSDLHIESEIIAEAKIDRIQVTIHPESEHNKSVSDAWEIDTTYSKFQGFKNTNFHEHIEVPATADTGHYHFHFVVVDMEGNTKEMERELVLQIPSDTEAPILSITDHPTENQTFQNGEVINISGTVSDNLALGGLYIGLIRVNQNMEDAEMDATNTITLLHMHDFDGATDYEFSAEIQVGASSDNNTTPKDLNGDLDGGPAWQTGEYYLLIKSPDAFGGGLAFSARYFINIEL